MMFAGGMHVALAIHTMKHTTQDANNTQQQTHKTKRYCVNVVWQSDIFHKTHIVTHRCVQQRRLSRDLLQPAWSEILRNTQHGYVPCVSLCDGP